LEARKIVTSLALVGMRPKVYQVFELARVTDLFAIYQDLDAALLALNSFGQDKHLS
jgi:anti-anti-sigma regulatory factor